MMRNFQIVIDLLLLLVVKRAHVRRSVDPLIMIVVPRLPQEIVVVVDPNRVNEEAGIVPRVRLVMVIEDVGRNAGMKIGGGMVLWTQMRVDTAGVAPGVHSYPKCPCLMARIGTHSFSNSRDRLKGLIGMMMTS